MSAQAENYTLYDFITDESVCASSGVDDDPSWTVPADSLVGRCMDIEQESNLCDECFQQMSSVYQVGDAR